MAVKLASNNRFQPTPSRFASGSTAYTASTRKPTDNVLHRRLTEDVMVRPIAFLLLVAASAACTSQQVYDSTRALRADQCQQLPVPEQEECMRQTHETQAERESREKEAARSR